ncbi:phosphotransferase [Streptomyces sp. TS71-3]|uniref:phosphotransferase n=1 Tax=Streptomyces sp. TS71-3 TaxID=2733862 RepID=UPI001B0D0AE2|nr:phosphotransferase [Streptomyces sp. TS71-3]GHJ35424.1 hypothetical protein Sm713_10330 [Streptomyces sp. TS71-3]
MNPLRFTKHYPTRDKAHAAARHYTWLLQHAAPLRQPALIAVEPTSLTFEQLVGRPAKVSDLRRLAALLGDAHGAAWASDLHRAHLDRPHTFSDGTSFTSYRAPRVTALTQRFLDGFLADRTALHSMLTLLDRSAEGPAAFYKDCNPRNFVIVSRGIVFSVDTDDLTLAPFGYDLAKLITTLAMTYGALHPTAIDEALETYNRAAARHDARLGTTDRARLGDFLALHAVLNAPYAGRNGYANGSSDHPRAHQAREPRTSNST